MGNISVCFDMIVLNGKEYPYDGWEPVDVSVLVGKTVDHVSAHECDDGTVLVFECDDATYFMFHRQDCCERVYLADGKEDLDLLEGAVIVQAEESRQEDMEPGTDSSTWTFYKFGTMAGYVTLRWVGVSNGCYGETVRIYKSVRP
jgi:hypothetical protein